MTIATEADDSTGARNFNPGLCWVCIAQSYYLCAEFFFYCSLLFSFGHGVAFICRFSSPTYCLFLLIYCLYKMLNYKSMFLMNHILLKLPG